MKINEDIKDFNKLPVFVNQHLSFLEIDNIKFIVAAFTFILLDLGTFPLLYPKIPIIYYIAIPLLVFIHLWAFRILIKNPFSTQFESLIYIGVLGVIGTICYFMLVQKTAYMNLGIRNLFYYVISTILYLFIIGILAYYQIQRYSNINKITVQSPQRRRAKKSSSKYGFIIAIFPAVGYFIAQRMMKQSDTAMYALIYLVFFLFGVIMAYLSAKCLHQYAFMKANMRFVRYQKPTKKAMKQAEAKGKKFIIK